MAHVYLVGERFFPNWPDAFRAARDLADASQTRVPVTCCEITKMRLNLLHVAMLNGAGWCAHRDLVDVVHPRKPKQGTLPSTDETVFDDVPESDDEGSDLVDEGAGP